MGGGEHHGVQEGGQLLLEMEGGREEKERRRLRQKGYGVREERTREREGGRGGEGDTETIKEFLKVYISLR